jgi:hypothetical protein
MWIPSIPIFKSNMLRRAADVSPLANAGSLGSRPPLNGSNILEWKDYIGRANFGTPSQGMLLQRRQTLNGRLPSADCRVKLGSLAIITNQRDLHATWRD